MRYYVLILLIGFAACSKNKNSAPFYHANTDKVISSIECQKQFKKKMIDGLALIDTEKSYDDLNKKIEQIITNGEVEEIEYSRNYNRQGVISEIELSTIVKNQQVIVDKEITLFYEDHNLYFNVEARLQRSEAIDYTVEQLYSIDSSCQATFLHQKIQSVKTEGNEIFYVEHYYVHRTDELESRRKIIPQMPTEVILTSEMFIEDILEKKQLTESVLWSYETPLLEVSLSLIDKQSASYFDVLQDKFADFDVITVRMSNKILDNTYDTKLNFSKISEYVFSQSKSNYIESEIISKAKWLSSSIIEVFSSSQAEEKKIFDIDSEHIAGETSFSISSNYPIKILNEKQYFQNIERSLIDGENMIKLQKVPIQGAVVASPLEEAPLDSDTKYLVGNEFYHLNNSVIETIVQRILQKGARNRYDLMVYILEEVNNLIEYDYNMIDNSYENRKLNTSQILKRKSGVCHHFANLAVTLSRKLKIPARSVVGAVIKADKLSFHAWIEAKISNEVWRPIEPQGKSVELNKEWIYLPITEHDSYEDSEKNNVNYKNWISFFLNFDSSNENSFMIKGH